MNQVGGIDRQPRIAASELDTTTTARKQKPVAVMHRVEDGFEFVKSIRTPAQDVEQQVDLAG
jgi:hypothetical protein